MANDAARPELTSAEQRPARHFGYYRRIFLGFAAVLLLLIALNWLHYELKSYALLAHFADPQATGPLLRLETTGVTSEEVTIQTPNGAVPGRLYVPTGMSRAHGIVVVPGIHRLLESTILDSRIFLVRWPAAALRC